MRRGERTFGKRARRGIAALLVAAGAVALGAGAIGAATSPAGKLNLSFLFQSPGEVHPTYHTAIWLEDESGALVKTLFVSQELSATEFQVGEACPDWVKKANWERMPKPEVDAVTGPTPDVGSGMHTFDLGALGIAPGKYRFNMQVHITDQHNLLFRGDLVAGDANARLKVEALQSPGLPPQFAELVREVHASYVAVATK